MRIDAVPHLDNRTLFDLTERHEHLEGLTAVQASEEH
jgi:hypothetical protein